MMVGVEREKSGGITQKDIHKIRKKVKIGDKIRVKTLKAMSIEQVNSRCYGAVRRGTVVEKYPCFAVVEFANGIQESILWIDLLKGGKHV
ncbi:hypothetical protein AALB64_15325 [Lachnospiraceae bacterium 45-P1]